MEKPMLQPEPVEIPVLFAGDDLKYMSLGSTGVILLLINRDA